jgi:hypothetical protein
VVTIRCVWELINGNNSKISDRVNANEPGLGKGSPAIVNIRDPMGIFRRGLPGQELRRQGLDGEKT